MSNPKNRFFDKSYQLILSKNGEVTSNIEVKFKLNYKILSNNIK
jgi:hypothetical protein